jgi:hypothetical protein
VRWTFAAIATTMVVAGTPHHAASAYTPTKQPAAGQNWQTSMGFSPTNPTESSRRDSKFIASEVGRSLIDGIILGGNVGPYLSGLHPAHIKSRITAGDYARAG